MISAAHTVSRFAGQPGRVTFGIIHNDPLARVTIKLFAWHYTPDILADLRRIYIYCLCSMWNERGFKSMCSCISFVLSVIIISCDEKWRLRYGLVSGR